jgi:hypothetical protein
MSGRSAGGDGSDSSDRKASQAAFDNAKTADSASPGELPEIDFSTFVLSLSHSALVHLGDAPNPASGQNEVSLPMARQTIDLLALLQAKSKGNLSGEEEHILEQALFDLRMRYVEVAKSK